MEIFLIIYLIAVTILPIIPIALATMIVTSIADTIFGKK
jgi:hypothetical protein